MKVLVSDNLGEAGIKMFQDQEGIEVEVNTGLSPEELKSIIGDYDALWVVPESDLTMSIYRRRLNMALLL